MSQEKSLRSMQQIENQHKALCSDYMQLRDITPAAEERLERIAQMYWQLRTQISAVTDTAKIEIDFR